MSVEKLKSDLEKVLKEAFESIQKSENSQEIEKARILYLGKKSQINSLMKSLANLDSQQKAEFGKYLNEAKAKLTSFLEDKKLSLSSKAKIINDNFDFSMPGRNSSIGSLHPITKIMDYSIEIFEALKFECVEGPEIEDDFHNFTALNIPESHPARAMHDTFYFEDNNLLRTHTSSVQIRAMREKNLPIRVIAPGKVYRKDSDITHTPMFHQIEGLYIDTNVSFSNLKSIINTFLKKFFENDDLKIRFRPSYFPFTEPSAEVDIEYINSRGEKSWLEILGCGMVHPNVLEIAKIDPSIHSGYAFGLGVERLAMLKLEISDLRLFYENDLRFLEQFQRAKL
tara:strand:- start:9 stop:1028 length:1020 start_codon:yes stop_codon:yes gene_type:complete